MFIPIPEFAGFSENAKFNQKTSGSFLAGSNPLFVGFSGFFKFLSLLLAHSSIVNKSLVQI